MVDYTFTPGAIIFVDGTIRGVMKFVDGFLSDLEVHGIVGDDVDYLLGAGTCLYINGYLYLGNTQETGTDGRRLIRWSSATDLTEFAQGDYVDFVKSKSNVLKLSSIENIPMVYTFDSIYAGFPSTFVGLPFQFIQLETGGVSATGMRAMTSFLNGQVFVGKDNIYYVQPNRATNNGTPSIEPIGNAVASISARKANYSWMTRVVYDPARECIVFGFDMSASKRLSDLYLFFPATKAWSRYSNRNVGFSTLSLMLPFSTTTWGELNSTTWSALNSISWLDLGISLGTLALCTADGNGFLYILSKGTFDDTFCLPGPDTYSQPISVLFETGDIDFNDPDNLKTATRFAIKTSPESDVLRGADIVFRVYSSTDSGLNWTDRGLIEIEPTNNKDEVHFREKGGALRFRITASTKNPTFRVDEILLRVKGGEREDVRG
jgi:hypothetical protein